MLQNQRLSLFVLLIFHLNVFAEADPQAWSVVKDRFFPNQKLEQTQSILLPAPYRAESGAQVPIEIKFDPSVDIKKIHLIVDSNPIPLTASYHFHTKITKLATRTRVEMDTYVHVVAETAEGKFLLTETIVKAAGGCSGTLDLSDDKVQRASAGKMKLDIVQTTAVETTVELNIKHPMRTGLQRDLFTQGFAQPFYIKQVIFQQSGKALFQADFGIGVSENPYLQLTLSNPIQSITPLQVNIIDNEGNSLTKASP